MAAENRSTINGRRRAGMQERVRELGGRLSLIRLEQGTLMRAVVPRTKADAALG